MKTRVLEMQGPPSLSTFLKGWNALLRCHHIQDKHVEEGDPAACWASKFTSTVEPGGTKPWIKFTVKNNNSSMNNRKVKCLHFTSEILRNPTRSTRLWEKGPLLWLCWVLEVKVKLAQLCPTLWDPMDYTVHGILQARILEWVAFPFSSGSSQPRDRTQVSHIAGRFFTSWAIREDLLENPQLILCKWLPIELLTLRKEVLHQFLTFPSARKGFSWQRLGYQNVQHRVGDGREKDQSHSSQHRF